MLAWWLTTALSSSSADVDDDLVTALSFTSSADVDSDDGFFCGKVSLSTFDFCVNVSARLSVDKVLALCLLPPVIFDDEITASVRVILENIHPRKCVVQNGT